MRRSCLARACSPLAILQASCKNSLTQLRNGHHDHVSLDQRGVGGLVKLLMRSAKKSGGSATPISTETALTCLYRLGAQNGIFSEIGVVRRRCLLERETIAL